MALFDICNGEGVIPQGTRVIPSGAFCDCFELERVIIPDSVLKIEKHAFRNCPNLKDIFISQSVALIEVGAFGYCPNVESVVVDSMNQVYDSRKGCNSIIITAKNSVLFGCGKAVHGLPRSIRRIESEAYAGSNIDYFKLFLPSHIKSIGAGAFRDVLGLGVLIILPNSIKTIPAHAFSGSGVWEVQFWGDNVKRIDSTAFEGARERFCVRVPAERGEFYRALFPESLSSRVEEDSIALV